MRTLILCIVTFLFHSSEYASASSLSTIDELTAQFDVTMCLQCHEEIANDYMTSAHAVSTSNSRFLQAFSEISSKAPGKMSATEKKNVQKVCLSCHVPQVDHAPDGLVEYISSLIEKAYSDINPAAKTSAQKKLANLRVNCRVCHMMKGMPEGKVQPKTIYGPGWDKDEESHKEEYGFETVGSKYLLSSEFCISCHDNCPPDLPESICSSLHARAERHYRVLRNMQPCQKCHMQEKDSVTHRFPVK